MSGYPDGRDERDEREDKLDDEEDIRIARAKVSIPSIGLIVVGALALLGTMSGFLFLLVVDKQVDQAIQQIENNPNIPAQQKKDQVDFLNTYRDLVKAYGPAYYAMGGVVGVIVLVGGLRMRVLGSPGLVYISALLAMLPFGGCCILGLGFGIWAFVAMMSPEVKAGYAARRRASYSPDKF
jgi:hypothetical protein